MLFLLTLRLKKINYSGENIGNDLIFNFNVKGHGTLLRSKISFGQSKSFKQVLFQEIFPEGSISLPISVDITEEDPVFNDTGSVSSHFNVQLEQSETHSLSFSADVIASGGDKAKKATFTFILEAIVDEIKVELNDGTSHIVGSGDKVFITGYPTMPQLVAKVVPAISGYSINVNWKLEIKYPRRGNKDDKAFPDSGFTTLPVNQPWIIYNEFNNQFFGGDATLICQIDGSPQSMLEFKIHGQNPEDSSAKLYIQNQQGVHWYARAIGQHESRQGSEVYNQFNTTVTYQDEPNFGAPDGWGMFQLDSASGIQIATEIVWNWKANVDAAISHLGNIRREAQAYFDAVQRTYPAEWEPPPVAYTPPSTSTAVPYVDAANIQLYNRASVVETLQNPYGETSIYRSCWKFHPNNPSEQRWEFKPNQNDYLRKAIEEYENNVS